MKELKIYCDAGSFNNFKDSDKPTFGSYGTILVKNNKIIKEWSDWYEDVSNNQMEVYGAIKGILEFLKRYKSNEKYKIEIISDSQYLVHGMNAWLSNWKKKNWINSSGKPVKNVELWKIIDKLVNLKPTVEFIFTWQKGHCGKSITLEENPNIYFNEYVDSLATDKLKYASGKDNMCICPENEFQQIIVEDLLYRLKINGD